MKLDLQSSIPESSDLKSNYKLQNVEDYRNDQNFESPHQEHLVQALLNFHYKFYFVLSCVKLNHYLSGESISVFTLGLLWSFEVNITSFI
jgi:hypothetical protein